MSISSACSSNPTFPNPLLSQKSNSVTVWFLLCFFLVFFCNSTWQLSIIVAISISWFTNKTMTFHEWIRKWCKLRPAMLVWKRRRYPILYSIWHDIEMLHERLIHCHKLSFYNNIPQPVYYDPAITRILYCLNLSCSSSTN